MLRVIPKMSAAVLTFCLAFVSAPALSQDKKPLDFSLDWVIGGRHAAYFLALEKGYYKQAGLDVKIHRGYGSADGIKRLASGRAAYAFADVSSLVVAQGQGGAKAKCVAAIYSNAPHGLTYAEGKGIEKPKDLEGKKIGGTAFSAIRILFPAFAKKNGIDPAKVEWIQTDPASLPSLLGAGKVDAIITYPMDTAIIKRKFEPMGIKVQMMQYVNYGLSLYSNGIIVGNERIENNPGEVSGFVRATVRGLAEAFNNPEEAVDLMLKTNPAVSRKPAIPEVAIVRDLVLSEEALTYGIGFMLKDKMEGTRDIMIGAYKLKETVPVTNLYTNEFLPKRPM